MKLFAFYIGGSIPGALIELHDVRFGIGEKIEDCYGDIRKSWWGTPDSLHLDCWGELSAADGHNIVLQKQPFQGANRLWFVNLGGYEPGDFSELHRNVFVVAPDDSKAKVRALKQVLHWKGRHEDYTLDVENICCINDAVAGKGLYIGLEPTDNAAPFAFAFGYNPDIAESLK